MSPLSIDEDNVPYVSDNPEQDWKTVSYVLAVALQNFSPKQWVDEVGLDTGKFLDKLMDWHTNYLVPRMNYYYDVEEHYTKHLTEPF
jgi:hypothetical protein